jgi:hypothetical protein
MIAPGTLAKLVSGLKNGGSGCEHVRPAGAATQALRFCHPERSEGSTRSDSRAASLFKQAFDLAVRLSPRFAEIPRLRSE